MSLCGHDNIPEARAFERSPSREWVFIGDKYKHPICHTHDVAWIVAMLHGVTTKSLGQVFEPPQAKLSNQQINVLCDKYSKAYLDELNKSNEQQARRAANIRLHRAILNIESRG